MRRWRFCGGRAQRCLLLTCCRPSLPTSSAAQAATRSAIVKENMPENDDDLKCLSIFILTDTVVKTEPNLMRLTITNYFIKNLVFHVP